MVAYCTALYTVEKKEEDALLGCYDNANEHLSPPSPPPPVCNETDKQSKSVRVCISHIIRSTLEKEEEEEE